ncbi:MAG: metallophosphoesterase [Candidatus Aminicenantales bacterium]
MLCFFVSDLHGDVRRYQNLFAAISREKPAVVFIGGDFLPLTWFVHESFDLLHQDFINDFLVKNLLALRQELQRSFPKVFLIMGNDDCRFEEAAVLDATVQGVWEYIHNRKVFFRGFPVYGYAFVPPTPFRLKDWERYDVSRYVDPGTLSPEEGLRSVQVTEQEKKYSSIKNDLERLTENEDLAKAIFLFHSPPYQTKLDMSSSGGKMIDYVPLDRHLGSIAIRRFIELRQPLLTLHGHVHEAARLSHSWRDRIGRTCCFSAAHDGSELALIRFDPEELNTATRELI